MVGLGSGGDQSRFMGIGGRASRRVKTGRPSADVGQGSQYLHPVASLRISGEHRGFHITYFFPVLADGFFTLQTSHVQGNGPFQATRILLHCVLGGVAVLHVLLRTRDPHQISSARVVKWGQHLHRGIPPQLLVVGVRAGRAVLDTTTPTSEVLAVVVLDLPVERVAGGEVESCRELDAPLGDGVLDDPVLALPGTR